MSNDDAAKSGAAGETTYALEDLPNGWQVGRFAKLSAVPGLVHAVTTRGALDVDEIAADRDQAGRLVGDALDLTGVAFCQQVHGAVIHKVDAAGLAGEGDGLVTNSPGLGVMCFSADCPLVLVADTASPAVGIAHASWRSTVQSVTARLIEKLREAFGCEPANLVAAIGPSAGPCCYQVGPEVVEKATRELGLMAEKYFRVSGGSFVCDLWGLNRGQLMTAGVSPANIDISRVCTICNSDTYPSYRKEGDAAGRFVAVIGRAGE
jgi:YfiH family protein